MADRATQAARRRIMGWMAFDWAQQPYATLGLTFIFAPYFAEVARNSFVTGGMAADQAAPAAQALWSSAQTVSGLVIALTAPFLGAWADATGRKLPWIYALVAITVICAAGLWGLHPDGTGLMLTLVLFWIGFTASESAFNLNNALLPSLGAPGRMGRIGGNAVAIGYWGGVLALIVMLLLFTETAAGTTRLGLPLPFGLDPAEREGTRLVGPVIAAWFALFMIPYMLWVREVRPPAAARPSPRVVLNRLMDTVRDVARRRSLSAFLLGSMFYRDGLSALYAYGGVYARLVLGWEITQIGLFGIGAATAAAILSWIGGHADDRFGPKPVIIFCIGVLIAVGAIIVGMNREALFGIPLAEGSTLPDVIFYICGAVIGGAGGVLYSASRSLMVRHADPEHAAQAFGLFALTGRATAFLAPALITLVTWWTSSNQLGFLPVIALFLLGLALLAWVDPKGDRTP